MSKSLKSRIATAALAGLVGATAFAGAASAKWVEKSDSWCRKRGFTPICEVWESKVADDRLSASRLKAGEVAPRPGQVRTKAKVKSDPAPQPR